MRRRPKLSIIIPAYNEEKRIPKTLDVFSAYFGKRRMSYELVVVMDGCTDATPGIVAAKARRNASIRYRCFPVKSGKGGALLKGFAMARGEYVAYTDADGSTPPGELVRLMEMMDGYDGIIGSRWMKGSVLARKQRPMRRIASRGFNLLTRMLFGLRYKDTQCPAKVFREAVIKDVIRHVTVTNFAIDACLLYAARKLGYRVTEVPIRWRDEPMSSLKMSKTIPAMFSAVVKTRFRRVRAGPGDRSG